MIKEEPVSGLALGMVLVLEPHIERQTASYKG